MSANAELNLPSTSRRIGLIAGWGQFPVVIAKALKQQGFEVYCIGVRNHADSMLKSICDDYREFGITRTGAQIRYFRKMKCEQATMAGKIFKTLLFKKWALLSNLPDLGALRCFYAAYISRKKDRRDDTLLTMITEYFSSQGVTFMPATDYAPELLVPEGTLTSKSVTANEQLDIQFGWQMAKEMGRLDIGQSVVVKDQAVMAVEAIEGTDECIKRAGILCESGGFTVVKVAKPDQDMRFDVPTIGVGTIETMKAAGGRVLAIEAEKTIVLDRENTIQRANQLGIKIVAVKANSLSRMVA